MSVHGAVQLATEEGVLLEGEVTGGGLINRRQMEGPSADGGARGGA